MDRQPPDYSKTPAPAGIGVRRKTAYALASLGLDVVQRDTLRALLPPGSRKVKGQVAQQNKRLSGKPGLAKQNTITNAFHDALKLYEKFGWISRGHLLVAVHNRGALLDHALQGQRSLPPRLLDLDRAIAKIREDQAVAEPDDRLIEQRHKELRALMRLMQAPVTGVNRSGTRSVRFVNRSRVI
jgi:hypothetical protein